jgi:cytochrome c-type biogenesis protein CcmH
MLKNWTKSKLITTENRLDTIGSTLPFWVVATALAMAAAALVAAPLFKGSSRRVAVALAVLLPAAAVGVYLLVGSPAASVEAVAAEAPAAVPGAPTDAPPAGHTESDIEELITAQKAKVETSPEDAAGWAALGLIYSGLDRWKEAEEAFAKAYALQPKEAAIVSAYAEALAINAGRDLSGRPMQLVREALELAAQDPKALELAAINAFQEKEYSKAAYYFRQLLKVLPEDSSYAADIEGAMREARRLAEEAVYGAPLDNRPPTDDVHSVAKGTISGTVELAPALAGKIAGTAPVYLYARPVLGGSAPLAGLRTTVDKLPADFTLDDSLSPLPDNPLSSHDTVSLIARIATSDAAEPQPGDLEGTIRSVTVGSQGVKLVIDTVRE